MELARRLEREFESSLRFKLAAGWAVFLVITVTVSQVGYRSHAPHWAVALAVFVGSGLLLCGIYASERIMNFLSDREFFSSQLRYAAIAIVVLSSGKIVFFVSGQLSEHFFPDYNEHLFTVLVAAGGLLAESRSIRRWWKKHKEEAGAQEDRAGEE